MMELHSFSLLCDSLKQLVISAASLFSYYSVLHFVSEIMEGAYYGGVHCPTCLFIIMEYG